MNFMQRVGHQDAQIVGDTRTARAEVFREARRWRRSNSAIATLTNQVLAQRNQVAAIHAALLNRQIEQLGARSADAAKLHDLNARLNVARGEGGRAGARRRRCRGPPSWAVSGSTPAAWSSRRRARPPPSPR